MTNQPSFMQAEMLINVTMQHYLPLFNHRTNPLGQFIHALNRLGVFLAVKAVLR